VTDQHSDSDSEFGRIPRPPRTTPPIIDRRVLPNGEIEEWERISTIPDDFIYDPEEHSYYPPGEGVTWDFEGDLLKIKEARRRREESREYPPGTIIWVDWEPRKKGTKGRKSLGGGSQEQLDLFAGLDDDDADAPSRQADEAADDEESADE